MDSPRDQVFGDAPSQLSETDAIPRSERKRRISDSSDGEKKKRRLSGSGDVETSALPLFQQPVLPTFNLTTSSRPKTNSTPGKPSPAKDDDESTGWQVVEKGKRHLKKIPKKNSGNYPEFEFSKSSRLQSQIKISDLQSLVLYILADGGAPLFVAVRHRPHIRKIVVLMIPGLEHSMFEKEDGKKKSKNRDFSSPDHYYPSKLVAEDLPLEVRPLADIFNLLWPVKTPGDDRMGKMHSPLHAMLTAPLPKEKDDKSKIVNNNKQNKKGARPARVPPGWKNVRTPITAYIHTRDELLENEYVVHSAMYTVDAEKQAWAQVRAEKGTSQAHGWVDSLVLNMDEGDVPENEIEAGSLTAGREILAMDCEMCMTGEGEFALTRISIVGWDGSVIMDELVKPDKPIINYLTQYSGMTAELLAPVTTTLQDIQTRLSRILNPGTILLGHSLNSDLNALKMTHPFIIDTALLYPHPRGPPLKSSLKWLAQRFLNREVQKGHGGTGHDSIEDAKTCLDLVKQKCEKGPEWGTSDAAGENIFKRVARAGVRYKNQGGAAVPSALSGKSSAAIDWGDPKKGPGATANFQIGCQDDEEVTQGVIRAVKGDADGKEIPGGGVDFIWARLREIESLKGWWNDNRNNKNGQSTIHTNDDDQTPPSSPIPPSDPHTTSNKEATARLMTRLTQIYEALPPCTAFVVYSGSGDPREMSRLSNMHARFKREYNTKKWDELSVKWTDTEEQALKREAKRAREGGLGFLTVK
ncbi:hypothetical protein HYALB_00005855 [Hymenoscyphus albidus]|uniref:Exonuclease domain-containing protein n=1 Tax=Hymenoscyphus albidus TaxID=595503 RepID=A0A9N9LTU5_9HELO|nr:hypothetical protein HYALB_00005855 [Hymenoscyphus albidus]